MPELPEVEVVKNGLQVELVGRRIIDFSVSGKKLRKPIDQNRFTKHALGQPITRLSRRAKYLLVHFKNDALMVIHLGMTGKLRFTKQKELPRPHDHLFFQLDDGKELRFHDVRRFGFVEVYGPGEEIGLLTNLGPEPFSEEFNAGVLAKRSLRRRQPIKNFLMDNRNVVGLGNIYANETLFAVRIRPDRPAGSLRKGQWQDIVRESRRILARAIKAGGSTISDFLHSNGEKGYFQLELLVYGRAGKPCSICGQLIRREVLAGRASFYCPHCQK